MGFFYQAIKKATGQATPETEALLEQEVAAEEAMAAAVALAPAEAPVRVAASAPPVVHAPKPKLSFSVQHPLPHLVAFLAPPVLEPNVMAMEQCRIIRTRLRDAMRNRKAKVVMMTSAMPSEGKTLMSVNLAYALSQLESTRVLLVDADMRHPSVANFLRMKPSAGLSSYLTSNISFDEVCYRVTPSLDVIATAEMPTDSPEILQGARMRQFLAEARAQYDVVLIDGPPVFPIVDAQVLTSMVEGVVMVVRANVTPYDMAFQAADIIKSKLLGTILNCVDHLSGDYYGRYGYGYGYNAYRGAGNGKQA